jgi:peptidyl-prolyl cis-trans isomerase SurA
MKFLVGLLIVSTIANAKIIDKIAGVIDNQTYTQSEIKRFKKTIKARAEISPLVYQKTKYSSKEIFEILKKTYVIKEHLNNSGFVISDDTVEGRIKQTEQRLNLSRADLKKFLASKGITFPEYFEVLREAMEYSVFNQRIISPLVSITDQEIKNYFYKTASNKNTLSFKYEIVDFIYPTSNNFSKKDVERLPNVLTNYQDTGIIKRRYKGFSTANLGKVSGEDLPDDINKLLKATDEGNFSKALLKDGNYHVFFVKKKDLTESSDYIKIKPLIQEKLFIQKSKKVLISWFEKEYQKHFIKSNL